LFLYCSSISSVGSFCAAYNWKASL
jgi:hypothetical protein